MVAYDAVVVGAGPNGLVAANHLLDAGWSVLVLEEQPTPGGAVRSDRELHPDVVQDTFSAFYPLAAASRTMRELGLERFGLVWEHAPAVLGHPLPDGRWAVLHRDRGVTAGLLDEQAAGDGERWLDLCALWDRVGEPLVESLTTPFPPLRGGARLLARLPGAGGMDLVRRLLTPAAELASDFRGPAPGLLVAGNAGHADLPLDAPGSGVFGLLLAMLGQTVGFPVPRGGAGALTDALVARFHAAGGELRCGTRVAEVLVADRRARGVRTDAGEVVHARRAVVADVSAPLLFGGLLAPEHVPPRVARGMRDFRLDPGTVKVDWALSGPVPWASPPPYAPGTVHVADSLADMARALTQVSTGVLPPDPFLLVGQMTTADPTRSPAGTESLWAYTHVPQPGRPVVDAGARGGTEVRGRWDAADTERYADRVQARLERYAPGFGDRVLARRVLGPVEMERRNASLVGGSLGGGTAQLHQELFLRPVPAMRGRAETGVAGLYLGSSSAHPGGGVHGAPGANAARAALLHHRWGRLTPWRPGKRSGERTGKATRRAR